MPNYATGGAPWGSSSGAYGSPTTPTQYQGDWTNLWQYFGYGASPQKRWRDYYGTMPDWSVQDIDLNPGKSFDVYGQIAGKGMSANMSKWLGNQFSNYYSQYQTNAAGDPTKWWGDYLGTINPYADFGFVDPYQRGERQNLLSTTMRMVR